MTVSAPKVFQIARRLSKTRRGHESAMDFVGCETFTWKPRNREGLGLGSGICRSHSGDAGAIFSPGLHHRYRRKPYAIEFVKTAFDHVGKDWRDYVTQDARLMRPTDITQNKVDPAKAATHLGWKAKNGMNEVIGMMLKRK